MAMAEFKTELMLPPQNYSIY